MSTKPTALVIGAGVGGLAVANILAKSGYTVTVYEQNAQAGGRMGLLRKKGFTFDTGPSWYLMKDVFEHYFSLFGKKTTDYYQLARLDPAYKVFFENDEPIIIRGDYDSNLATFESREAGAARQLEAYLNRGHRNYVAALQYFLYNPFKKASSFANLQIVAAAPSFARLFTGSLHNYVAQHLKRQELQQILEYPSVFLGASPFNTPALYQLMSYLDFKEGVFYPKRDGMYAVVLALKALGRELGVKYCYNHPVSKIVTSDGRASGIMCKGSLVKADVIISNADLPFTETKLLPVNDQTYPKSYWSKRQPGPSALLLYLGVKGDLPELEHHNLFFVDQWKQNFEDIYNKKTWPNKASMYVSKTTATDPSTAPKGHQNIFVLVPLPASDVPDSVDVDARVDHYLQQLEVMANIPDLRQRIVVKEVRTPNYFGDHFNAWHNTALGLSHTLRQTAFLRPSVKSKKLSNLYYVGAGSQPGIGVPMCLISAELVYKYIVNDWSAGPITAIREAV